MIKIVKVMFTLIFAVVVIVSNPYVAKAAEVQTVQLTAEQQALLLQAQAMQQAMLAAQYQAAVQVQNGFTTQHNNAMNQAFMLQQINNLRYQQYKSMIQRSGLDYQGQLLTDYQKYQNEGLKSFLGYNGY